MTVNTEELLYLLNRRRFLAGSAALAAVPWKALAQPAAPYVFKQGDAEIAVVSDGELTLPLNAMAGDASPEQLAEIAKRMGWPADAAKPHANVPVIKIASDVIVVDNGSGKNFSRPPGSWPRTFRQPG